VVGTLAGAIDKKSDTGLLAAGIALNLERLVGFARAQVSPSVARVRFIDLGGLSGGLLWEGCTGPWRARMRRPPGVTAALGSAWPPGRHACTSPGTWKRISLAPGRPKV